MNLSVVMAYGIPSNKIDKDHTLYNNIVGLRVPFCKPWYKHSGNFDKSIENTNIMMNGFKSSYKMYLQNKLMNILIYLGFDS